jgi:glycosyltransferase involved in cell wall biosynthesis
VHATELERIANPHVVMLAAALAPVEARYVVDDVGAAPLPRSSAGARALAMLPDALRVARLRSSELRRHRFEPPERRRRCDPRDGTVLAIWRGAPENTVGGSITHAAGILRGFRSCGLRVVLATAFEPPPQLRAHIDDVEVAPPIRAPYRLTRDSEGLALNAALTETAITLGRRIGARFVYQRHDAFLTAGAEAAEVLARPLILEWNGSEVWTRANWLEHRPFQGVFDRAVALAEVRSVAAADVIAAVSNAAADMAINAGALPDDLVVSPNAVDLNEIDAAIAEAARELDPSCIGWIGTFGPWHGAEVLVRALDLLPPNVKAIMIGEGAQRMACERLAESLGVRERVEFTGGLPHADALRRLSACGILASPHVPLPDRPFFGSPTKLFEYMALGRPIVASGLEQIASILDDQTAYLVRPGDVGDFARGVSAVLADRRRAAARARSARAAVTSRHTWEHRARALVNVVDERFKARRLAVAG